MTTGIQQTLPSQPGTMETSRVLADSLAPGRHELSSRRLGHVYGDARMTPSARTRVVAELDRCGLLILSDPCNEPLVVVKRPEMPTPGTRVSAGHEARRVKVLADRAADEALRSGQPVALPAMTDAERDIVHARLRWNAGVVARSAGEGSERHLVLIPI